MTKKHLLLHGWFDVRLRFVHDAFIKKSENDTLWCNKVAQCRSNFLRKAKHSSTPKSQGK